MIDAFQMAQIYVESIGRKRAMTEISARIEISTSFAKPYWNEVFTHIRCQRWLQ